MPRRGARRPREGAPPPAPRPRAVGPQQRRREQQQRRQQQQQQWRRRQRRKRRQHLHEGDVARHVAKEPVRHGKGASRRLRGPVTCAQVVGAHEDDERGLGELAKATARRQLPVGEAPEHVLRLVPRYAQDQGRKGVRRAEGGQSLRGPGTTAAGAAELRPGQGLSDGVPDEDKRPVPDHGRVPHGQVPGEGRRPLDEGVVRAAPRVVCFLVPAAVVRARRGDRGVLAAPAARAAHWLPEGAVEPGRQAARVRGRDVLPLVESNLRFSAWQQPGPRRANE